VPEQTVRELDSATSPRYRQIAGELMAEISGGVFAVGAMLPPEADLCERFCASRFTVREALRLLTDRGVIQRRRGAGTVVTSREGDIAFVQRMSSIAELLKYPPDTSRSNLFQGPIHADPALASTIDCPVGCEWFRISGLRLSDSGRVPISWSDIYILPELAETVVREDNGRRAVYEIIEQQTGISVYDAEIRMFASSIDGELARLMAVAEGTPALSIVRRYTDERGRNFETTVTIHPEKRFVYSMQLHRDRPQRS
jgi:GntR family transcriptional regulator